MKDRFRFRAWNKEEKKMHYDVEEAYEDGREFTEVCFAAYLDEDWEIMQCTGMMDLNKDLVYENDYVVAVAGEDQEASPYREFKVIWTTDGWGLQDIKSSKTIRDVEYHLGYMFVYSNVFREILEEKRLLEQSNKWKNEWKNNMNDEDLFADSTAFKERLIKKHHLEQSNDKEDKVK